MPLRADGQRICKSVVKIYQFVISVSLCVPTRLSAAYLSVWLSNWQPIYLPACLPACLSICRFFSVHRSLRSSGHLPGARTRGFSASRNQDRPTRFHEFLSGRASLVGPALPPESRGAPHCFSHYFVSSRKMKGNLVFAWRLRFSCMRLIMVYKYYYLHLVILSKDITDIITGMIINTALLLLVVVQLSHEMLLC